jgi:hypothetical protein
MNLVFFHEPVGEKADEAGALPDISCASLLQVWLCKILSHQMSATCRLSRGMSRPMMKHGSYLS